MEESVLGTNFLKEAPGSLITNTRFTKNFSIALIPIPLFLLRKACDIRSKSLITGTACACKLLLVANLSVVRICLNWLVNHGGALQGAFPARPNSTR